MLARIDLASAHLHGAHLEGAGDTLEAVLAVEPYQRLGTFVNNLGNVRAQLAQPPYRNARLAQELQEPIECCAIEVIGRTGRP